MKWHMLRRKSDRGWEANGLCGDEAREGEGQVGREQDNKVVTDFSKWAGSSVPSKVNAKPADPLYPN
jgi:hypothetical protein